MVISSCEAECEAEYVTVFYVVCQTLWIEILLKELNLSEGMKIKLLVDNKWIIDIENHPMSHGRNKHTKRKYYFLRD